ncbi:uncharacterized protein LOC111688522 [Lucilia cuprina]|uniref:uncharacterized protein LOC111688522 n=1 Tax=Lucilia cuprina TaxID=7375 RepID=UPI001F06BAA0|nr:uncharacterized protein LOC111688522 [Lucilia cuprina]
MNLNNIKCLKKTTYVQFQKLFDLMEEFPLLATGNPSFGSNKLIVEQTWDNAAQKLNALGPPIRNGQEWKRYGMTKSVVLKEK